MLDLDPENLPVASPLGKGGKSVHGRECWRHMVNKASWRLMGSCIVCHSMCVPLSPLLKN